MSYLQALAEFGSRRTESREAEFVHGLAATWWNLGIDHAPMPQTLALATLRSVDGPVDSGRLVDEGQRYTELLIVMIATRETSWAAKEKARMRPRIVVGGKR